MAAQNLDKLIATLSKSIRDALNAVEEQSIHTLMDHFEVVVGQNGQKTVTPKMITMPFPMADGSFKPRDIPSVALLHHNALQMEELRIKFRVGLSDSSGTESVQVELAPSPPVRMERAPSADPGSETQDGSNFAEVDIFFKRGEPPEGTARVIREYNKCI